MTGLEEDIAPQFENERRSYAEFLKRAKQTGQDAGNRCSDMMHLTRKHPFLATGLQGKGFRKGRAAGSVYAVQWGVRKPNRSF